MKYPKVVTLIVLTLFMSSVFSFSRYMISNLRSFLPETSIVAPATSDTSRLTIVAPAEGTLSAEDTGAEQQHATCSISQQENENTRERGLKSGAVITELKEAILPEYSLQNSRAGMNILQHAGIAWLYEAFLAGN
ncbi:hypothetical protein AB9P05_20940 [Roseivirga sp. BDSF3-8]|uniref:hypothetical protein n=1 Tax=Roseivirga sp. BDSF3-8 TaxID=3241598 RepID=UPI00353214BB